MNVQVLAAFLPEWAAKLTSERALAAAAWCGFLAWHATTVVDPRVHILCATAVVVAFIIGKSARPSTPPAAPPAPPAPDRTEQIAAAKATAEAALAEIARLEEGA